MASNRPDLVEAYERKRQPSILEDLECPRCGVVRRSPEGAPHQRMPLCFCGDAYDEPVYMRFRNVGDMGEVTKQSGTYGRWHHKNNERKDAD